MSNNLESSQWAAGRGEKWRRYVPDLEAMMAPVDEPLLDALRLDEPCRIADVGCGGGGTTQKAFERAPSGSVVHGFDISPALIDAARNLDRARGGDVTFQLRDVSTAEVPQTPYHRLFSRFGIMFFDDPPAAFGNLVRWLAPGGRAAFAVWGPPEDNPWAVTVREEIVRVVALPSADPGAPGPFRYGDPGPLRSLLEEAGLRELEILTWKGDLAVGGGLPAREAARFALESFSIGEYLSEAAEEAQRAALEALTARFADHEEDGAVRLGARVHLLTGVR